jgi:hypothetical protein
VRDTGGIEPPPLLFSERWSPCVSKQVLPVPQLGASPLCYRIQPPMGLMGVLILPHFSFFQTTGWLHSLQRWKLSISISKPFCPDIFLRVGEYSMPP